MPASVFLYVPNDAARTAAARLGTSVIESAQGPVLRLSLEAAARAAVIDAIPVRAVRTLLTDEAADLAVKLSWWGCAQGGVRQDMRLGVEVRSRWAQDRVLALEAVPSRGLQFRPGVTRSVVGQWWRSVSAGDPLQALFGSG